MSIDLQDMKRQAAEQAAVQIQSGMVVGLGTGSTAVHMVRALGRKLANGELENIVGIPTSEATAAEARKHNIPLTTLTAHPLIDITIDGADEIDPQFNLIKGLGGALLREKIVAIASKKMIMVGDYTKSVTQLGTQAPVPVEVVPFAQRPVTEFLATLASRVELRQQEGQTFYTDENNIILDCYFDNGIADPYALSDQLNLRPGVVEHGLFLDIAVEAFLAGPEGVEHRQKG